MVRVPFIVSAPVRFGFVVFIYIIFFFLVILRISLDDFYYIIRKK